MDFRLTAEQTDIKQAAIDFAKGEFDPDAALGYDKNQQFPSEIWKNACGLGFIGVHFPERYGGQDCGLLENALIIEAFCRNDSGIGMALALSDAGSEILLRYGDDSQKRSVLPLIAQGKAICTIAFLEKNHSLTPLKTSMEAGNNGYIINGEKIFVTLGNLADYIVVSCQTKYDNPLSQSVMLLEREIPGIAISSMGEKMGMRTVSTERVSLSNVVATEKNIIGQGGSGYTQLQDFLKEMRIKTAAMGIGIAMGGIDKALEYSKKRWQFGKPIVSFDAIKNKLADMYMETEMARLITYNAACSFDAGRPDSKTILMSKMAATRAAYRVTYEAVQIHGGYGYMTEGHIERFYRDAKALGLFLETGQMRRSMLADQITGQVA